MYEKYRNEIQEKLISILDPHTLNIVMTQFDFVSASYKFEKISTEITVRSDDIPPLVKMFMVS